MGPVPHPHPWLMPDFWQFPTRIGRDQTNQCDFIRLASCATWRTAGYEINRRASQVGCLWRWRDGRAGVHRTLTLATREKLDNLTFIVNCNLQRLDGPVRGNGQIIQELESLFIGAGWNVIKVLWGSEWDALFCPFDKNNVLLRRFAGGLSVSVIKRLALRTVITIVRGFA